MLSSDTSGVGGGLLQRAASSGGGIAARLAALQHNGQSAWRKRVQKDEVVKISATSSINQAQDLIRSQLTCPVPPSVPVSEALGQLPPESRLAARLGQLETASQGWKRRVGVSDARQFSVAGRMRLDSEEEKTSPLSSLTLGGVTLNGGPGERQRRTPRPERFKCKSATNIPRTLGEEEHSALTRSTSLSSDTPHPSPLLNGGVTTVGEVNGGGAKGGETGTNVGEIANDSEATKRGEVGTNGNETTNGGEINGGDLTTNGSKAGEVRPNGGEISTNKSEARTNGGEISTNRSEARTNGGEISTNRSEARTNGGEISTNGEAKVAVPRMDSDLDAFFVTMTTEKVDSVAENYRIEDFDCLVRSEQQLVNLKKPIKVTRRRGAGSKNPIRALSERTDLIRDEYSQVNTGLADRELKRINIENLSQKNANLAVEALAGLASKEDFAAVALKSTHSTPPPLPQDLAPYLPLMLLQVKGRRHVQTRLVRPSVESVNSGDSYVLVTPSEVYHYTGEYANVIEKSRGSEIAQHIIVQHDLGCTASHVYTISDTPCKWSKKFWRILGASETEAETLRGSEAGHPDEDELYEMSILDTNMIYELQSHEVPELVPVDKYWGSIPRIEMLDINKILVFDFGTELYIWMGKNATLDRRKQAISLCKQLWMRGVDYTDCDISPLGTTKRCDSRPPWCLLAKVTQHMETCLFREKFADWPDFSRVIRLREKEGKGEGEGGGEIVAVEGKLLAEMQQVEPDLVLEGTHLGRGVNFFHEELRKLNEIRTLDLRVWHIEEFESSVLPEASHGQFFSGDSYIVRWHYSVTITGRELSGQPSRHNIVGRDRFAYFIWQGSRASLNEQGAAALLTVQLDEERGPQVRIGAGHEPPAFLNIFNGAYVCYEGKRSELKSPREEAWRLFTIRGSLQNEAQMLEVACSIRQLRSRACLLLVNTSSGQCYLWQGARVTPHIAQVALTTARNFLTRHPRELGTAPSTPLSLIPVQEGQEPPAFFSGLGGEARHLYHSALDLTPVTLSDGTTFKVTSSDNDSDVTPSSKVTPKGGVAKLPLSDVTPRMFALSSTLGVFSAIPVVSYIYHADLTTPFPYLQSDLYAASQPSLFLLDTGAELWLWQGWWPQEDVEDEDTVDNVNQNDLVEDLVTGPSDLVQGHRLGSRAHRYNEERRVAMETALSYWRHKYGGEEEGEIPAYLVWAGLEPATFTNLFQIWSDRGDVAEINIKDGHKPGEILLVQRELAKLSRSTYPPSQLLQRPLPEGVDPTKLELYLSPEHFLEILGMPREEFVELPVWKQCKMKQAAGLF